MFGGSGPCGRLLVAMPRQGRAEVVVRHGEDSFTLRALAQALTGMGIVRLPARTRLVYHDGP